MSITVVEGILANLRNKRRRKNQDSEVRMHLEKDRDNNYLYGIENGSNGSQRQIELIN